MLGAFGTDLAATHGFFERPWSEPAAWLSKHDKSWLINAAAFRLRALGRLEEAVPLTEGGLRRDVAHEAWENAAISAGNLCDLRLLLGSINEAIRAAEEAVVLADQSGNRFRCSYERTTLAFTLHHAGMKANATALFEESEEIQAEYPHFHPQLYAIRGFRYCDLLLGGGGHREARERASKSLELATRFGFSLLATALDHLSLGRAEALALEADDGGDLVVAIEHLDAAVDGLRAAAYQEQVPRGLIARAALFRVTKDFERARRDLDEVLRISTRRGGAMPLFECDARLEYVWLHLAQGERGDRGKELKRARQHLERAREIIAATGYHRRDGDLAALQERVTAAG